MSDRLTLEPRSGSCWAWQSSFGRASILRVPGCDRSRRKWGKLVRGHFSFDQKTLVDFVLGNNQLSKIATFSLARNPCLCSEIISGVNHSDSGNVFSLIFSLIFFDAGGSGKGTNIGITCWFLCLSSQHFGFLEFCSRPSLLQLMWGMYNVESPEGWFRTSWTSALSVWSPVF